MKITEKFVERGKDSEKKSVIKKYIVRLRKHSFDLRFRVMKRKRRKIIQWCDKRYEQKFFADFPEEVDFRQIDTQLESVNKRNIVFTIKPDNIDHLQEEVAVKQFNQHRLYDSVRFSFLKSKAIRSLTIALSLITIGLKTPVPFAAVEKRGKMNNLIVSTLFTEYLDVVYSLKDVIDRTDHAPPKRRTEDILPKLAQELRRMHDHGIVHNDLHVGNILIRENEKDFDLYYVDLNRARILKEVSMKRRLKDMARIRLTYDEQKVLISNYTNENSEKWLDSLAKERENRNRFRSFKKKIKG